MEKEYEIILFDLDDTLIDNTENIRYAYTKMVESVGEEYSEEGFQKWYQLDAQFWIDFHQKKISVPKEYQDPQELFVKYVRSLRYKIYFEGRIDIEKAFEINELFLASLNEIVVPIDGVSETLSYLSDRYKIVIATNGPTVAVNSKLDKIDCLDFISDIFSADMTKRTTTKPSIEYFEELKEYLKFYDNNKMLIVGDSLCSEIQGGMNIGIDSCWFNPNKKDLPNKYTPTYIINDLRELKKIL